MGLGSVQPGDAPAPIVKKEEKMAVSAPGTGAEKAITDVKSGVMHRHVKDFPKANGGPGPLGPFELNLGVKDGVDVIIDQMSKFANNPAEFYELFLSSLADTGFSDETISLAVINMLKVKNRATLEEFSQLVEKQDFKAIAEVMPNPILIVSFLSQLKDPDHFQQFQAAVKGMK